MSITAYHGIGAYRGQRNPLALRQALVTAMSGVELCASDRAIGAFGVIVTGYCRRVWDQDVYSTVTDDGARTMRCTAGYVEPVSQAEFLAYARAHVGEARHMDYCEAWMTPRHLRAIWVKAWASPQVKRCAEIMAAHRGVPLYELTGADRIWDLDPADWAPIFPASRNPAMALALHAALAA